ncbi:MAG: phosphate acyltransferase PlsX [Candidatus Omnitrophota bacterium]|nr:MAG: phosphate acyltransferase PlsX [Candidatus Omnitrophota bacterium]
MKNISIALDVMGGDKAPFSTVKSLEFIKDNDDLKVVLVGEKQKFSSFLSNLNSEIYSIVECKKFIPMGEKINRQLLKEKDTTMARSLQLLKEKKVDIALSAGNTAAFVALSISNLGLIEGVERPVIAILLPNISRGNTIFLDAGANVNVKSSHLLQSAIMGSIYAEIVFNIKKPKVALLNIGEEETKGDDLRKQAYKLMEKSDGINFIGNIEGQEIFTDKADVIVTDGFTGNVVLKTSEGITRSFKTLLLRYLRKNVAGKIATLLVAKNLKEFSRKADYAEYGGGILLGVDGIVLISHGRSSPRAIYSAMKLGKKIVDSDFLSIMKEKMKNKEN